MKSRALAEPYQWEFETTVTSVDGPAVVLEETYFYPEGGGQPPDRGRIGGVPVVDVQSRDGQAVHELATAPDFEAEETVGARIDPAFRTYCMRAHTASHLLYGAGRQLLDELGYGGFDIGAPEGEQPSADGKVRVDFTTSTEIDDETLVELERLTNQAVWDSRRVSWETMAQDVALGRDNIAFNTKTEEGLSGESVRVVTVEDWDVAACGGTHVRNTREIGPVTVLERSNPGEGMTRVEFAVGQRAIERRATDRRQAMEAAQTLETGIAELPAAVERLHEERNEFREALNEARDRLVEARVEELAEATIEKEGNEWLVGVVRGLDANGLAKQAQKAAGSRADVVALVGESGEYLAVATGGVIDAGEIIEEVTDEFGGGGGGGPTMAQGGGLDVDSDELISFLCE